jgi:DNA-binding MarR family transcriptional regulator
VADEDTVRALEHEMGVLVRRLRRLIADRAHLVHPDLAPVGYSMLVALQDEPRRASDLVDLFSIDKGAVSRQVQSLLELELIERSPDPDDRRAAILTITDEGARRLEAAADKRRAEVLGRLSSWQPGDLQRFVESLARYNATLETPQA